MMLQLTLTFVLVSFTSSIYGQDVVHLIHEQYTGTIMTTRNGRNISAFLGMRYAKPPIGPLRFKNPQPWYSDGFQVLSADTDGNDCPQLNNDGKFIGDEDCLFLNVYSPNTTPRELYPTMVYFHGGDNFFAQGSGSSINAGPEYLLDRDIVLVTVNYRLGVLGFLSTGDAQAPGNFGLKDQVVALEWIKRSIIGFGGHPSKITIFGQGAGGVSTGLHAIFPRSTNLFQQYISQSGSTTSFWAFRNIENYKKRAFDLGRYLNCPATKKSEVLVDCLRKADAYDLVNSHDIFKETEWVLNTWGPTLEKKNLGGAFITQIPLHQMLIYGLKDCPAIIGSVSDEGLKWTAAYYTNDTLYNSIKENLLTSFTYTVKIFFATHQTHLYAEDAMNFYFNGSQTTDKKTFIQNLTNFLSDAAFRVPLDLQLRSMTHIMKAPIYYYEFDYRGSFTKSSVAFNNNDNIGVGHGDDLIYLFPTKTSNITQNESDEKMIDIMLDFFTSFAHMGTPTSGYTSDPNVWKRYDSTSLELLKIGENSDPMDIKPYPAYDHRLVFWNTELGKQLQSFLSAKR